MFKKGGTSLPMASGEIQVKILGLNGSPRRKGNTELLLTAVLEAAKSQGAQVKKLDVCKMAISPCLGCGKCERNGECSLDDDMSTVYPLLEKFHHMVLATPVYFYGVTAQLKALIDRCQPLWSRKYILGNPAPSTLDGTEREGHLISVAGSRGKKVFDGVILTAKVWFDAINVKYRESLLARGIDKRGGVVEEEELMKKAWELGLRLARGVS